MCEVCSKDEWKYKCPKCVIRYCSLDCFKSHECNPPVQKTPIHPQKRGPRPLQLDSDDETDLLTSEQLQSLNCDAMTQLLGK